MANVTRALLCKYLQAALGAQSLKFSLSRAPSKRGEWTSNAAFIFAARHGENARKVAQRLAKALNLAAQTQNPAHTGRALWRVEEANGFLNFRLDPTYLNQQLNRAQAEGARYGLGTTLSGQRINVEWVSADPTGPLSANMGRIAALGEALCRVLEAQGANVTRECFLNDDENSSKLRLLGESVGAWYRSAFDADAAREVEQSDEILGDEWVRSVAREAVKSDGNRWLLAPREEAQSHFTHLAREAAVRAQRETLEQFGVRFDTWSSESTLLQTGRVQAILDKLQQSNHAYQRDGEVWLRSSALGDETDRPLTRRGRPTYLATDIAYHAFKFERGFARLINIWTAEHRPYVARTQAALRAAGLNADALQVLVCEGVRPRRDGIAISGAGTGVTLNQLLQDVATETLKPLLIAPAWDEIAVIDTEAASRDEESNPAYALQLAPSRLTTLLHELEARVSDAGAVADDFAAWTDSEIELRRLVALWPDELESAAQHLEPQRIARFALEFSQVVRADLMNTRADQTFARPETELQARVQLLRAARGVARQALQILGISGRDQF